MPKILRPRACVNGVVESHLTAVREQLKKLLLLRLIFQVLEECRVNPRPLAGHKMRDRGCCLPYEVRSFWKGVWPNRPKTAFPEPIAPALVFFLLPLGNPIWDILACTFRIWDFMPVFHFRLVGI